MLTPRQVISLTVSIAVVSILWSCLMLLRPPDSEGMRGDSYGTYSHGYRALYDTLKEIGVPVRRSIGPPTPNALRQSVLVFWNPSHEIVQIEQKWLQDVGDWVRGGGHVVVASQPDVAGIRARAAEKVDEDDAKRKRRLGRFAGGGDELPSQTLSELLGIPDVTISHKRDAPKLPVPVPTDQPQPEQVASEVPPEKLERAEFGDVLREVFGAGPGQRILRQHSIRATGALQTLISGSSSISMPAGELNEVQTASLTPSGEVFARSDDGDDVRIAARFDVGQGAVTVLGTPAMISNSNLGSSDNVLLAARLLADGDRELVFDEFYHGLTFRGNAMWLFAHRTYGSVTLALLLAMGLLVWHSAVILGEPLAEGSVSRRSVKEHVEAMARFLCEGKGHTAWILPRVRDGLLWHLRHEHGLPPEKHSDESLLAAVERRDPERAAELTDALAAINEHLHAGSAGTPRQSVTLLQRMTACLSKNVSARSAKKSRKSFTARTTSSTSR